MHKKICVNSTEIILHVEAICHQPPKLSTSGLSSIGHYDFSMFGIHAPYAFDIAEAIIEKHIQSEKPFYMGQAIHVMKTVVVSLPFKNESSYWQIVIPDAHSRFPWQENYDVGRMNPLQPLLYDTNAHRMMAEIMNKTES